MKRYRNPEKGGGLFSAIEHQQAVARKTTGILKLRDLISWESFRPLLEDITGYAKIVQPKHLECQMLNKNEPRIQLL